MFIVVPIALLVLALVTFILGFVRASLTFDYVSIAASAASFVMVAVLTRLGRAPKGVSVGPPPAPLPLSAPPTAPAAGTGEDAGWLPPQLPIPVQSEEPVGGVAGDPAATAEVAAEPTPADRGPTPDPGPAERGVAPDPGTTPPGLPDAEAGEVEFPIADYDELEAEEILPLLPLLYPDEIDLVRAREVGGRGRRVILDRLDELAAAAGPDQGVDVGEGRDEGSAPGPAGVEDPLDAGGLPPESRPEEELPADEAAWEEEEDSWLEALANGAGGSAGETSWDDDEPWEDEAEWEAEFPIADYDQLRSAEIVPLLKVLDPDELELVRARELAGRRRSPILNRIDALLSAGSPDGTEGGSARGRHGMAGSGGTEGQG